MNIPTDPDQILATLRDILIDQARLCMLMTKNNPKDAVDLMAMLRVENMGSSLDEAINTATLAVHLYMLKTTEGIQ